MRYPVGKGTQDDFSKYWYIASFFGEKRIGYYHSGDDYNLKTGGNTDHGQPLYAIADGVISGVDSVSTKGFGKQIFLKFQDPLDKRKVFYAHYAHCDSIDVVAGQEVEEEELLGRLGRTGTTFSHLHFSIKNKANGMDNVPKTKEELKEWENPTTFIKERLSSQSDNCANKDIPFDDVEGHRHTWGWYVSEWAVEKNRANTLVSALNELKTASEEEIGVLIQKVNGLQDEVNNLKEKSEEVTSVETKPIAESTKEIGRLVLFGLIGFGIAYVAKLPETEGTVLIAALLRYLDKYLHEKAKVQTASKLKGISPF